MGWFAQISPISRQHVSFWCPSFATNNASIPVDILPPLSNVFTGWNYGSDATSPPPPDMQRPAFQNKLHDRRRRHKVPECSFHMGIQVGRDQWGNNTWQNFQERWFYLIRRSRERALDSILPSPVNFSINLDESLPWLQSPWSSSALDLTT